MDFKNISCQIKIKRVHFDARLPRYEHPGDSGADLYACEEFILPPLERKIIPTGLCAEVAVLNTPGTIDAGYRGEIKVILINLGQDTYRVKKGQKIAQLVVTPVISACFQEVDEVSESERGAGGFGSTGLFEIRGSKFEVR